MVEESLTFPSGRLALEARLGYADELCRPRAKVLICPPHPFLGGDMHNNVVARLYETLVAAGFVVLRFNYRGIGASQGERALDEDQRQFWEHSTCPEYEREIHADCASALCHLGAVLDPALPVHVIGYSFGCLPATALSRNECVTSLVLISPPLAKWPIDARALERAIPRGLFYAPGDFACPADDIERLFAVLAGPRSLHAFADTDHFFVGREDELAAKVHACLLER